MIGELTNCKNCGAPLSRYPCRCEYCGTEYGKYDGEYDGEYDLQYVEDAISRMLKGGVVTVNEARRMVGLDSIRIIDNSDEYYWI